MWALALCLVAPAVRLSADELRARYDAVWAVSDVHGHTAALEQLLVAAGLSQQTARGVRWKAARQLFVVDGDSGRMRKLQRDAEAAGSRVIVIAGNHEAQLDSLPRSVSVGPLLFMHGHQLAQCRRKELKAELDALGFTALLVGHDPDALAAPGTIALSRNGWFMKLDSGMKRGGAGMLLRCDAAALELSRCALVGADGVQRAIPLR